MFEDLFTAPVQGRKWIDGVSAECRQFCEELADEIIRRGREPSWMATLRLIKERFPQDAPSGGESVSKAVRQLVKERG